jgi:methionyl-tRNA synthetase
MAKKQYITTAIDYPNAAPHMGQVLEKVQADVCARWFRLRGDSVRFQIGTDEHGLKIQQTAAKQGITPKELVDRNVPLFQDLYRRLNVSSDFFIRTTDKQKHWPTVQELWRRLQKVGVLEKRPYVGLYCTGCERFVTKKDLVDGKCPDHQRAPEQVTEENWFFLLHNEQEWLKEALGTIYKMVPSFRSAEMFALLKQGLEDVSFSRPKESLSWGIPVPGDESQTMYVWCDALTNYISGIDIFGLSGSEPRSGGDHERAKRVEWWDDAHVTHVIGKDIARFHALIWPAMLRNAGIRLPDTLLIHGFLTNEGQKMSKTVGNVVDPEAVLKRFGGDPDPLRFYLSHEIPVGNDGDFSPKRFEELYDAKLRNQIGNLLNRILVLLKKEGGQIVDFSKVPGGSNVEAIVPQAWSFYEQEMNSFVFHNAVAVGGHNQIADLLNQHIGIYKPWERPKEEKIQYLSALAEAMRHVALMLLPFVPAAAQRISKQLNVPYADKMLAKDFVLTPELKRWGGVGGWKAVGEPEILFAPLVG